MSDANAEARARADLAFGVWNDQGVEAMADLFWHPDVVWEEDPSFPDGGVHHGRDATVARMKERFEFLGYVRIEVVDARRIGSYTLVEVIVRGEGSSSGAAVEQREFFLLTIEDHLSVRFREFLDRDQALAAAQAGE